MTYAKKALSMVLAVITLSSIASAKAQQSVPDASSLDNFNITVDEISSADTGIKLFINYVDKVRLPKISKTNPVLAADLKKYFHNVPEGMTVSKGELAFTAKMASLEKYVKENNSSLSNFAFIKIADLVFDKVMQVELKNNPDLATKPVPVQQ